MLLIIGDKLCHSEAEEIFWISGLIFISFALFFINEAIVSPDFGAKETFSWDFQASVLETNHNQDHFKSSCSWMKMKLYILVQNDGGIWNKRINISKFKSRRSWKETNGAPINWHFEKSELY